MSSTRVKYNAASATGQQIAETIDAVNAALAKFRRLQLQINSMTAGNDWPALEAEVGGMTVGQGQTLWTILATAKDQLDSPQIAELARLDQG